MLVAGIFISCEKDDPGEIPGEIPGMGNAGGELEVLEPFVLPEGISIVGEITGINGTQGTLDGGISPYMESSVKAKYDKEITRGSGDNDVVLDFVIENSTSVTKEFFLPRGCVFKCLSEGRQNGLSCQKILIRVLAGIRLKLRLHCHCLNKGIPGSSLETEYEIMGVSSSKRITKLVEKLESKKIDISDFSPEEKGKYKEISTRIKKIVHSITNGSGVKDSDWKYIKSLKER